MIVHRSQDRVLHDDRLSYTARAVWLFIVTQREYDDGVDVTGWDAPAKAAVMELVEAGYLGQPR